MNGTGQRIRALAAVLALIVTCADGCDRSTQPCRDLPERNAAKVSITQGIWGDIWFWSGSFMPPCGSGTVTAASRDLLVHELTPIDSVLPAGHDLSFFSEIRTALIAVVRSDDTGFFQVSLPPGTYSLFVREDSLYYANRFDGHGNIWPVAVIADSVTGVRFDIEYEASE